MSAPDPDPSEVPSTARLAWLLFMQPIKLDALLARWGLVGRGQLWAHRREPHARRLIGRMLSLLLVWNPILTLAAALLAGTPLNTVWLMYSLAFGWALGGLMALTVSMPGTVLALTFSVSFTIIYGFMGPSKFWSLVTQDWYVPSEVFASAAAISVAFGLAYACSFRPKGLPSSPPPRVFAISLVGMSAIITVVGAMLGSMWHGVLTCTLFLVCVAQLNIFPLEAFLVAVIATAAHDPERGPRWIRWLPYRHHDLIFFPLPGLKRVFIDLAEHSPNLARELIDEALRTIAQKRPAQRAFDELQARALRQAADASAWPRIIELRGSFFPAKDDIPADDILQRFIAVATDLYAVESGGSQHRRRNLLDKAAKQIDDFKKSYLASPTHDRRTALLYEVTDAWSAAIANKRKALTWEMEEDPEIPNVYVVGPSLNPTDPEAVQLFRARRDLITIIERDLDDTQRGVIFLVGQRRMGKTSLLAMLPTYLGTATTVVTCDFQGLSGSEHPTHPHRWVVQLLAAALARVPGLALPEPVLTDAWGSALLWLTRVDAELARIDHRALVAIDEVERLQDAHNQGWGNLGFLDFVRAAGDKLRRVRLLLVSAHPLANPKLGPAWVDRLISVFPRTLGPLDPGDAEALLCHPVPTFPSGVFDDVAPQILAATGHHPFLIQAVGKEVVQRLLIDRRRVATAHDVERALDGVLKIAESALFTYLWDSFDPAERTVMRALADGSAVNPETGTFRVLREQWFVDLHDGQPTVAFPLFARWIRDYRGEHSAA